MHVNQPRVERCLRQVRRVQVGARPRQRSARQGVAREVVDARDVRVDDGRVALEFEAKRLRQPHGSDAQNIVLLRCEEGEPRRDVVDPHRGCHPKLRVAGVEHGGVQLGRIVVVARSGHAPRGQRVDQGDGHAGAVPRVVRGHRR